MTGHEPLGGFDCDLGAASWGGDGWESPSLAAVEQVYPDFLHKGWLLSRAMPWTDFLAVVLVVHDPKNGPCARLGFYTAADRPRRPHGAVPTASTGVYRPQISSVRRQDRRVESPLGGPMWLLFSAWHPRRSWSSRPGSSTRRLGTASRRGPGRHAADHRRDLPRAGGRGSRPHDALGRDRQRRRPLDDPCTAVIPVAAGVALSIEGFRIESTTCRGIHLPGGNAITGTIVELATSPTPRAAASARWSRPRSSA